MGIQDFFHRVADGGAGGGPVVRASQALLAPFGAAYGVGAWANRFLHDMGAKPRVTLDAPVLSVGNITMGGTGKTPFTIWLAGWLAAQGHRPAILTRGYRRRDEESLLVVHDGQRLRASAREAGDEPVLMGRALRGVPIVACARRSKAGRYAIRHLGATVLVLDDGFQHHGLARDGDIVLVDATRPSEQLELFPRGTLREPLAALSHAHLLVLTRWNQAGRAGIRAAKWLRANYPYAPLVRMNVTTAGFWRLATGDAVPGEELAGASVLVACAVGNPRSVAASARAAGLKVASLAALPDHATLTPGMIARLERRRRGSGATHIVITEKDAVKLPEAWKLPPSVVVMRSSLEFVTEGDSDRAARIIAARLAAGGAPALLTENAGERHGRANAPTRAASLDERVVTSREE